MEASPGITRCRPRPYSGSEIASFAVVVDAKDEHARRFYEPKSFLPFPDQPMKLFRPMTDIEQLFK
jgi:hypothetical protein